MDLKCIGGRQLGFLIDIPESIQAPTLELVLQLPKWIPAQSFTVQVNGSETAGSYRLALSDGRQQTVSVPLDRELIKPGRNFLSVLFERTYSPEGESNWQVSAQIRSIRIFESPQTEESVLRHQ